MRRTLLLVCLLASVLGALATAGAVVASFRGWDRGKLSDQYLKQARRLAAQGKHEEAQEAAELAVTANPNNPLAHRELAMHLQAEGRDQEAIAELQIVEKQRPWDPGVAWELALALRKVGDTQDAVKALQRVTEITRRNALAHALTAEQMLVLGEAKPALREAREAVRIAPGFPQVQHVLGLALWKEGDLAGAKEALEEAWQLRPADPGPLLSLTSLAEDNNRPEEAVSYLQRAAQAAPKNAAIWSELAATLAHLGRQAEAEQALARAQQLRPAGQSGATKGG